MRTPSSRTSEIQEVSFVAEEEEEDSSETLPYQQTSKEINPGSFTLPCTVSNLKIYVMADVGVGINMIPKSLFEHLKLANLKKTNMVIEMGNMTKKAPLGIVENIPLKIDKFLFHSDFVVIDTLEEPDETILLGRPFLATIHAQINVFRGDISLGVGNEKVNEYFNPHEMENNDSPALEQITFHYSEESVDTVDSSSNSQENEVCEEDCGIWPTCNPDLSFCSGYAAIYEKEENGMLKQWICFRDHERQNVRGNEMKFDDFLKVRYGNKNIDDVTRERRYYEWVAQNYDFKVKSQRTTKYTDPYDLHQKSDSPPNDTLRINTYFHDVSKTQPKKSRIRENSFEEWMKIKLGHTNISDSMRWVMLKEWVNEDFNFRANIERIKDDLYSRNFDVYKDEVYKEIEQLWYDEGFEEEKLWQNGIEEIDYTPPLAKNETFEVHRYTFKNGKSSLYKKVEFEVPLTRIHVVERGNEVENEEWKPYTNVVLENMHQLPREGVWNLAKEFGVLEVVVEGCMDNFFIQEEKERFREVWSMFKKYNGNEKIELKEDEQEQEHINLLEERLYVALWYIVAIPTPISSTRLSLQHACLLLNEGFLSPSLM
ncbi:phospholipase-like protein [Tanacetum coccineum]